MKQWAKSKRLHLYAEINKHILIDGDRREKCGRRDAFVLGKSIKRAKTKQHMCFIIIGLPHITQSYWRGYTQALQGRTPDVVESI